MHCRILLGGLILALCTVDIWGWIIRVVGACLWTKGLASLASTHPHSHDNQKYLQTLPYVPQGWGGMREEAKLKITYEVAIFIGGKWLKVSISYGPT